jgi:hypothetical protein
LQVIQTIWLFFIDKSNEIILRINGLGYILGDFLPIHLVTLALTKPVCLLRSASSGGGATTDSFSHLPENNTIRLLDVGFLC